MGLFVLAPNRFSQLGAKPLVDGLPLEDHQVAAALMGNVGGLPSTEPVSALCLGLALSTALSLHVKENKLFGQLNFGKPGRTDSSNSLPSHKRTSTSVLVEVFGTLLHGHNAGIRFQPLSLSPHKHDIPRTDQSQQGLHCHDASARATQLP